MKKNIKLIALDMDGTVFNEAKEVTKATKQAIQQAIEQGVVVVPATGRPVSGLPEEVIEIPGVRYAITSNGARIVDLATGETLHEALMSSTKAIEVLEAILEFDGAPEVYIGGKCYSEGDRLEKSMTFENLSEALKRYIKKTRNSVDSLIEYVQAQKTGVEKIHMMFENMEARTMAMAAAARIKDIDLSFASSFNMEITAIPANKGDAVLALADILGIQREKTMACGDSLNDKTMIQKVGFSVAMGNAEPEIKALADYVTRTNDEDGVAYAIQEFVLN